MIIATKDCIIVIHTHSIHIDAEEKADLTEDVADLNQLLTKFWLEIDKVVRISPSGSMLRDLARLDIELKAHSMPSDESQKVYFSFCLFPGCNNFHPI